MPHTFKALLTRFSHRLFEPSPKLHDRLQRRQARLLSAILFALTLSLLSGGVFTPEELQLVRSTLQYLIAPVFLLYLLSRSSRFTLAALLVIPLLMLTPYLSLINLPVYSQAGVAETVMWLLLPMFVAVITLPLTYAIMYLTANAIVLATLPIWVAGFEFRYLSNGLSFIVISSILMLVIASLRQRDVDELHTQMQQLETEASVRRQAEMEAGSLQRLLNSINEGVMVITPDGEIERINKTAVTMFGLKMADLFGLTLSDILTMPKQGSCKQAVIELLNEAAIKGHACENFSATNASGATLPVEVYASPIRLDGWEKFVITIRDITAHKRAERMKDEFVSSVSHELRTPLTSIHGAIGMINGLYADKLPEHVLKLIKIAYANSVSLSNLVNDILDISRLEAGSVVLQPEPIRVDNLLHDIVNNNAPYAERYRVNIKLPEQAPGSTIMADKSRLTQVLNNLVSNAIKFSPQNGQIEIDVAITPGKTCFTVTDHGKGIPAEYHEKIFEKFFQVETTSKQQRSGTGLGLSISQKLIEQMQGRIWVESTPGNTRFYVELPSE